MTLFYLFALIPVLIGFFIWWKSDRVVAWEWAIGCLCAFAVAGAMHYGAIKNLTGDTETWSGTTTAVEYHTAWVEQYQQMHTRTVGSGKDARTEIYYTTEYDHHPEHWVARLDFGSEQTYRDITHEYYSQIKREFGSVVENGGKQPSSHGGFRISGDNNIYSTRNKTGFFRPVTQSKDFENRIKASRSVFSFAPPPTNAPIFQYPVNNDIFLSDRLLGAAKNHIGAYDWDVLNSRLGPRKLVNLILVGFEGGPTELSQYQEALWIGGKKNDLVLTYGCNGREVTWARVFGWTESDVCKRNLETIMLKGIERKGIFADIEKEVTANYTLKDWSKFDYISIEPQAKHFVIFFGIMILTQTGLYIYFHRNEHTKRGFHSSYRRFGYGSGF